MAENILEAIDALLGQPFCSTDRSVAQEIEKWQQELVELRQRLGMVGEASERRVIEESCRQVMAQVESRLAAANSNLFRVSPQVEYATFELASTLTALTAANTLATVKENINHLLSAILQDVQQELRRIFEEERSATLSIIKTEISQLFNQSLNNEDYNDRELLTWINDRLAEAQPTDFLLFGDFAETPEINPSPLEEDLFLEDLTEEQSIGLWSFDDFTENDSILLEKELSPVKLTEEQHTDSLSFDNFTEDKAIERGLSDEDLSIIIDQLTEENEDASLFDDLAKNDTLVVQPTLEESPIDQIEEALQDTDRFLDEMLSRDETGALAKIEKADQFTNLDLLLEELFNEDNQVKTDITDQLSFNPPPLLKSEDITTIDVETIEDQLNDFADRVEISFTIPGVKKTPLVPTLPSLNLEDINDSWFLGIDFGNSYLRGSLSNLTTGRVYDLGQFSTELMINDRVIRGYKPLLQIGLPYRSNNQWRPIVQWTGDETIPLVSFLDGIKQILNNLKHQAKHPELTSLPLILQHLNGVVFGYPEQWDDAYIFNLREVILNCGFCSRPEQVIAVPQIIAPLLDRLHNEVPVTEITLFIDSGVHTTELLLVKPIEGKPLTNENLFYQTIDKGGEQLSISLIQELLIPQLTLKPSIKDLLPLAESIKVTIDRDDIWFDQWQGQKLSIGRSAYIKRVCEPFLQILNRYVNGLLIRAGLFAENVKIVVRSGGTMEGKVFQEWLSQKFPHAMKEENINNANGLAVAPRFYGLLDLSHQQYSDFFLVHEICKLNWQESMHPATVLQQLQQRGINVHSCVNRVISILQNSLPKGIIPQDPILVPDGAIESFLESGGLFTRLSNGFYQIEPKQLAWMDNYLAQLCNHLKQSITEPMVFAPQTFLTKAAATK